MQIPAIEFNKWTVRVGLGVVLAGALALGIVPLLQSKSGFATTVMGISTDGSRFTAAEILARFPKEKHEEFMRRAIANSRKAAEPKTGGVFGAVIVAKDGTVIADGMYRGFAENDPTWHAETHAIRVACARRSRNPRLKAVFSIPTQSPAPCAWLPLTGLKLTASSTPRRPPMPRNTAMWTTISSMNSSRSQSTTAHSRNRISCAEAVEVWKEYKDRKDKAAR